MSDKFDLFFNACRQLDLYNWKGELPDCMRNIIICIAGMADKELDIPDRKEDYILLGKLEACAYILGVSPGDPETPHKIALSVEEYKAKYPETKKP